MKRRTFLKTLIAISAVGLLERYSAALDGLLPKFYATKVPQTPFDAPPGTWTLVVLPDTQYYSQAYPAVFMRQTEWIAANKDTHQIRFVAHEGDLVNNPTDIRQWQNAQQALKVLTDAGIPFSILPGNHDLGTQDEGETDSRSTLLNVHFQESDYRNSEAHGLFEPGKMENSWHEFSTPTGRHLLLALEFGPRDEVLAWANDVVSQRPDHKVIVVTHSYLCTDNRRNDLAYDNALGGRGNPKWYPLSQVENLNDGQDMWNKFVSKHPNISFVLNGHICGTGTGYLESKAEPGNTVHQILANYQDNAISGGSVQPQRGNGGGGFMRLMQFHPNGQVVQIRTYSPWYNQWLTEPSQEFVVAV